MGAETDERWLTAALREIVPSFSEVPDLTPAVRRRAHRARTRKAALAGATSAIAVAAIALASSAWVGHGSHQTSVGGGSALPSSAIATTTPIASPAGPTPQPLSAGFYACPGDDGMAVCSNQPGQTPKQLNNGTGGIGDVSIDSAGRFIYYRQLVQTPSGMLNRIDRLPVDANTPQVLVSASSSSVSLGSPVVSPDGKFLAYGQMTLSAGAAGASPTRRVQVFLQRLDDLAAPPIPVPQPLLSGSLPAGPLLGFSANSRELYFTDTAGTVSALDVAASGIAQRASLALDATTVVPGCQLARTLLTRADDFIVVAACADKIEAVRAHDGHATPDGTLLNTAGWQVTDVELDTTGRMAVLWWSAAPQPPTCVGIDGSVHIVDGVPLDIQLHATPGCIQAG